MIGILLLGGCGPSEEAIATMTASAWTPTPEPTLTPTPMPFDLDVMLQGEDGESVFYDAVVAATEHEDVMANADGKVELLNLPGPEVEVSVTAQGYVPTTETVTLERGKNTKTVTLSADPLQINPATACQEGQQVLYIEDFEDGFAQGWDGISRPKYTFDDVEGRGKVLTFSADNTEPSGTPIEPGTEFGNMVWKWDVKNENDLFIHFHEKEDQKYLIRFQPGGEGIQIIHQDGPEHKASAYRGMNDKEWTSIAIAYFGNSLEFWINGELYLALDDPDAITAGGLMMHFTQVGSPASLDNMVICSLDAPYAPPVVEEVVEE
jgi:hypothetical protein